MVSWAEFLTMVLGLRLNCGFDPLRQGRADIRARVNHSNPSRVLPSTQTIKPAPRSAVLLNPKSAIYGDTLSTTAPRTGFRDTNPRGFDCQRDGVGREDEITQARREFLAR